MKDNHIINYKEIENEIKEDIKDLKQIQNKTHDFQTLHYLRGKIDGLVMAGQTLRYYIKINEKQQEN